MLLSLQKNPKKTNKQTNQQQQNTQRLQQQILARLHHRWRCNQAIALNDQQVGSTSLALLSP